MGVVRVSRQPITPDQKKEAVDLKVQYNTVFKHKKQLIIGLIVSICINIGFIVKLLIN